MLVPIKKSASLGFAGNNSVARTHAIDHPSCNCEIYDFIVFVLSYLKQAHAKVAYNFLKDKKEVELIAGLFLVCRLNFSLPFSLCLMGDYITENNTIRQHKTSGTNAVGLRLQKLGNNNRGRAAKISVCVSVCLCGSHFPFTHGFIFHFFYLHLSVPVFCALTSYPSSLCLGKLWPSCTMTASGLGPVTLCGTCKDFCHFTGADFGFFCKLWGVF